MIYVDMYNISIKEKDHAEFFQFSNNHTLDYMIIRVSYWISNLRIR